MTLSLCVKIKQSGDFFLHTPLFSSLQCGVWSTILGFNSTALFGDVDMAKKKRKN